MGCACDVRRCRRVLAGVGELGEPGGVGLVWGRVWADVHGCANVCGMNFQNFFQRIESLHQRTLIRILYEFLCYLVNHFCRDCFSIFFH